MNAASRTAPQGATMTPPLLLSDWQPYEYALSWLERMRALLVDSGGWTAEDQGLINTHARALLVVATTPLDSPIVLPPEPIADPIVLPIAKPRPSPAPKPSRAPAPSRNGHRAAVKRWSLNDRLVERGYPEDLPRADRIRLGQAVVEAYKQKHGKAPAMADRGLGSQAKRVALYQVSDLPMVDAVTEAVLGDPPILQEAARVER